MSLKKTSLLTGAFARWAVPECQLAVGALSFSTLFSLLPFLIVVVTLLTTLGLPFTDNRLLFRELTSLLAGDEGRTVRQWLRTTVGPLGKKPVAFSLVLMIIGTTSVFVNLQRAVEVMWEAKNNKLRVLHRMIKSRLFSLLLVMITIVFIIISLFMDTVLRALQALGFANLPVVHQLFTFVMGAVLLTVMFTLTFKFITGSLLSWNSARWGGAATALFMATCRALLRAYFAMWPLGSRYGAAAWAVIVPLWVFVFWQIFMFGLQLTWELQSKTKIMDEPQFSSSIPA